MLYSQSVKEQNITMRGHMGEILPLIKYSYIQICKWASYKRWFWLVVQYITWKQSHKPPSLLPASARTKIRVYAFQIWAITIINCCILHYRGLARILKRRVPDSSFGKNDSPPAKLQSSTRSKLCIPEMAIFSGKRVETGCHRV